MTKQKEWDFINFHTIKNYVREEAGMKSADEAVSRLIERFNQSIKKVIGDAGLLSRKARRKTILLRDIEDALEENLGQVELTWEELLKEVLKQNPTDLGKISQGIRTHLRKG